MKKKNLYILVFVIVKSLYVAGKQTVGHTCQSTPTQQTSKSTINPKILLVTTF